MKKQKAAPKGNQKKLNKNNKSSPILGKIQTLVKAMSAKPAKKTHTKAPAKPAKAPAKVAALKAAKPVKGADKGKKVAPTKVKPTPAPVAKVHAKKESSVELKQPKKGIVESKSPKDKAPVKVAAAAVLKKKGSEKKLTAAQLHDAERMCRETACENFATTKGYCRLHYIQNWKKIKRKEMILKEGKLNQYVEELVSKYPDKYIEVIRQDLSTEVNFNKVIHDLELDESIDDLDYDGDSIDSLIGSIRKDGEGFDDDEF